MTSAPASFAASGETDAIHHIDDESAAAKSARKRAAKALSNAKQRCGNPNNPDYPNYGGAGIMVLFKGVSALIEALGLPKPAETLDRIDPSGHYEAGNVRWANQAVQAANKKLSAGNVYLSASAQTVAAKNSIAAKVNRKVTAVGWIRALGAFNVGYMPDDHAEWMAANFACSGVIDANFDFDTIPDWLNQSPGYIHLPALSLPAARIRIRAMPPTVLPVSQEVKRLGRLGGLEHLPADWNVPKPIWQRVCDQVIGKGPGLVLHGRPTPQDLLGGGIEGMSLAIASSVASELKRTAACYPMLRVRQMLVDLGSPAGWD